MTFYLPESTTQLRPHPTV